MNLRFGLMVCSSSCMWYGQGSIVRVQYLLKQLKDFYFMNLAQSLILWTTPVKYARVL